MTSNDNRLSPAWDETRNGLTDDGLTEHGATQDVTDGSIGGKPHLLQLEFCEMNGSTVDGIGYILLELSRFYPKAVYSIKCL